MTKRDAGCPPSPHCVSRGPCQRSASGSLPGDVPPAVRGGRAAGLLPGVPPLLSTSFPLQACSGRRGSELAAAVPRLGNPTWQHSPILTPSLPAPWLLAPTCRSADTSQRPFAEGAQPAVPHCRPPTSALGAGGLPTPLLPAQLPPSARQDRGPTSGRGQAQVPGAWPPRAAKPPWAAIPLHAAGLGSDPCSTRPPPPQKPKLHAGFWPAEQARLSAETHPHTRQASQATSPFFRRLLRLPHAASHPTGRLRPCPCRHPNLTPRAGAARFLPTPLAAARPRCLPCRPLLGLVPQGAF